MSVDYDALADDYRVFRVPYPRIAAQIREHLENVANLLNIGAGTGAYEPSHCAISAFALLDNCDEGLSRLQNDLASGAWRRKNGGLLERDSLDLGYRLVVSDRHE